MYVEIKREGGGGRERGRGRRERERERKKRERGIPAETITDWKTEIIEL